MKRLGIFLFYDQQGIADEYIRYLLKSLETCLDGLAIVVNGAISSDTQRMFSEFSENIRVRANKGFDVGGWREAILSLKESGELTEFDELVLFNDSFFGPFYPFEVVFNRMEANPVDFWGLSVHGSVPGDGTNPYGFRPRYLQTYFLVFRKKMIQDEKFYQFWRDQKVYTHAEDLAEQFSSVLTQFFSDQGYRWAAYSDTADLESDSLEKNFDQHSFNNYELIIVRDFPVLKRRVFTLPKKLMLRYGNSFDLQRTLKAICKCYNYNFHLIYDHLLRKYDPNALMYTLNLIFTLGGNGQSADLQIREGKVAFITHLYYPELFESSLAWLSHLPTAIDLFISTDTEQKKQTITELAKQLGIRNQLEIRVFSAPGREWAALLHGFPDVPKRYEYLGFTHDKKSSQKEFSTLGASFNTALWENMLSSEAYVREILETFDKNPSLGVLIPPPPYWGTYFKTAVDFWAINFSVTKALAERLDLASRPNREIPPISLGSAFWCRSAALTQLFEGKVAPDDFPREPLANDGTINHALERILPFVAASNRYLSGWVMSAEYARTYLSDTSAMIGEILSSLSANPDYGLSFATFENFLFSTRQKTGREKIKLLIRKVIPESAFAVYRKIKRGR